MLKREKKGGSPYREGTTPGGALDIKEPASSILGFKYGKRCAFQKRRIRRNSFCFNGETNLVTD